MKKGIFYSLVFINFFILSCSTLSWTWDKMIKKRISAKEVIEIKEKIDKTANPAKRELMQKDVKNMLVELKDVLVKDIVSSTNIYYKYAVIVEIPSTQGTVAFFIYADDIDDVAVLKKGKSRINVVGYFGRYFGILSDAFINIEILDADIELVKNEKVSDKKDQISESSEISEKKKETAE